MLQIGYKPLTTQQKFMHEYCNLQLQSTRLKNLFGSNNFTIQFPQINQKRYFHTKSFLELARPNKSAAYGRVGKHTAPKFKRTLAHNFSRKFWL
jgi:hypothetical protein